MSTRRKQPKNKECFATAIKEAEVVRKNRFTPNSIRCANYAHRIYLEWFDQLEAKPEGTTAYPLNADLFSAFLISMRTNWEFSLSTVVSVFAKGVRRYQLINYDILTLDDKLFTKKLADTLASLRANNADKIKTEKFPLLTAVIYNIIDSWTEKVDICNVRDKCLLILGNILGARCDTLAHIQLYHLKFKNCKVGNVNFIHVEISLIKDKNRKKRITNVTHHSQPERDPVLSTIEWLWYRKVFKADLELEELILRAKADITFLQFKDEAVDRNLFISLSRYKFNEDMPLKSASISKVVTLRALDHGFKPGEVSGHSLRKGCATQVVLNDIENNGTTSDKTFRVLERHIGWQSGTNVMDRYVNSLTYKTTDTCKLVTNDKRESASVMDIALQSFSPTLSIKESCNRYCNSKFRNMIHGKLEVKGLTAHEENNARRKISKKEKLIFFNALKPDVQKRLLNNTPSKYKQVVEKLEAFAGKVGTTTEKLRFARVQTLRKWNFTKKEIDEIMHMKKYHASLLLSAKLSIAKKIINEEINLKVPTTIVPEDNNPEDVAAWMAEEMSEEY